MNSKRQQPVFNKRKKKTCEEISSPLISHFLPLISLI